MSRSAVSRPSRYRPGSGVIAIPPARIIAQDYLHYSVLIALGAHTQYILTSSVHCISIRAASLEDKQGEKLSPFQEFVVPPIFTNCTYIEFYISVEANQLLYFLLNVLFISVIY